MTKKPWSDFVLSVSVSITTAAFDSSHADKSNAVIVVKIRICLFNFEKPTSPILQFRRVSSSMWQNSLDSALPSSPTEIKFFSLPSEKTEKNLREAKSRKISTIDNLTSWFRFVISCWIAHVIFWAGITDFWMNV